MQVPTRRAEDEILDRSTTLIPIAESRLLMHAQAAKNLGRPKIAFDDQSALSWALRHRQSKICRDNRLAFIRDSAGDKNPATAGGCDLRKSRAQQSEAL